MTDTAYRPLRVALLGAGSVGSQVASLLITDTDELAARVGAPLELVGVAVRDLAAPRDTRIPAHLLTTDAQSLVGRADIVVELMGGIEPARELILTALAQGADIVTANKALIATHGPELFRAAERVGAQLYYEAAVGGAIPIVRPIRENLGGDRITRVLGIVNGTTNFILDAMTRTGSPFEEALAEAQGLGLAEADPTADVEGFDAAQKAAILASIAFHTTVPIERVHREGITGVTPDDLRIAREAGHVVKLLAVCERIGEPGDERVSARVYPALVEASHPLAAVHRANNAVFVESEAAGDLMFYGAGAGGRETASAVLGDLVTAARRHVAGGPGIAESTHADLEVAPIDDIETSCFVSLRVRDEPGVLAELSAILGEHAVSVKTLSQTREDAQAEPSGVGFVELTIGTHRASERALRATVLALARNEHVQAVKSVMRVEGS